MDGSSRIFKTKGIVLSRKDYSETSLIMRLFTQEHGKINVIAKGAKRTKSSFRTAFGIASLNEIIFYKKDSHKLSLLSEAILLDDFRFIHRDIKTFSCAHYLVEFVDRIVHSQEISSDLFDLLTESLTYLCSHAKTSKLARVFEIKTLDKAGLFPDLSECVKCKSAVTDGCYFDFQNGVIYCKRCYPKLNFLFELSTDIVDTINLVKKLPFEKAMQLEIDSRALLVIRKIFFDFIRFHIHSDFKTHEFLKKCVFSAR